MADASEPVAASIVVPVVTDTPATVPDTPAVVPDTKITAPAVEVPAAPAAPAAPEAPAADPHPSDVPSLLDAKIPDKPAEKPVEAKPEEAKPGDKPLEAKVDEIKPPAVEPEKIEWKVELPETLKADEPTMAKFTGALDNLFKPETRDAAVKDLVSLHETALKAYADETYRKQISTFNDTRSGWQKQVLADPEIGGAGHKTAMGAIARVRDAIISSARPGTQQYEQDAKDFNNFLRITGAGDNPVFLKALHRAARFIDEPSSPPMGAKPTKTNGVNPNRSGSLYTRTAG